MERIRGIEVELEQIPGGFLAWLLLPRVSKLAIGRCGIWNLPQSMAYPAALMMQRPCALCSNVRPIIVYLVVFFGALQRVTGMRYALMRTFCAARAIFFASVLTPTISSYT